MVKKKKKERKALFLLKCQLNLFPVFQLPKNKSYEL